MRDLSNLLCDSPAHIEAWFQLTLFSLHKQSYLAGAYNVSYALHGTGAVCIISPSLQIERLWGLQKKKRERERTKMSQSTALRWFWKIRQRAKGTAFAPASTSTGQRHAIRAACSDPDDGATLLPALCMWILDPDLEVDGEWGQRLARPIRFDDGVTTVGGNVANMQLIATSSNLMSSDRVVNWGKGASVDISHVRGHCVLRLGGKRVVPRLTDSHQLALLRTCLSPDMRATLGQIISSRDKLADQLDEIADHFWRQCNVALHRVKFEQRHQDHGETFDHFYVGLRELAADADLCWTCLNDRLTTRIMTGVASEDLRKKLLAINPFPRLEDVIARCRSKESATNTEAEFTCRPVLAVNVVSVRRSALTTAGRSAPTTTPSPRLQPSTPPATKTVCRFCGGRPHQTRSKCPAYGTKCTACNRLPYFANVCESWSIREVKIVLPCCFPSPEVT